MGRFCCKSHLKRQWMGDSVVPIRIGGGGDAGAEWSRSGGGCSIRSISKRSCRTIISCGRLPMFLICRGLGRSWRRTILRLVDHRVTEELLPRSPLAPSCTRRSGGSARFRRSTPPAAIPPHGTASRGAPLPARSVATPVAVAAIRPTPRIGSGKYRSPVSYRG